MTSADIYKNQIVFSYEGDLWLASTGGGMATRLTSFPGEETYPRFSPDGRWIAFIGNYDGPPAVYRIPSGGGVPQRLTWQPGTERTIEWTPDGKRIIFSSLVDKVIQRDPSLYSVAMDGTVPERLPIDRGSYCSFSSDGKKLVYNRRTYMPGNWKRYHGGRTADIWTYDFETQKFDRLPDRGCVMGFPMWIGGKIYFVCDCAEGVANLCAYSIETGAITEITHHKDFEVEEPSTDGKQILYVQNGYLNLVNVDDGPPRRLKITLPTDHWQMRDRMIDPKNYIHAYSVSNDGKKAVLEARGDLFTVPTGKGQVKHLNGDCASRELHPRVSPDGKQVAFFSDRTGEYQLYLQPVSGGPWTTLTTTLDRYPDRLEWSPDGKKILFGYRRTKIFVYELEGKKLLTIDEVEKGSSGWSVSEYAWAPDSNWICYAAQQDNDNSQIFIYSLEKKKRFAVTSEFYDNDSPRFDKNGDYLYYLSCRNFSARMDLYGDDHILTNPDQVMAVQLRTGQRPPFLDKDDDEETSAPSAARPAGGPRRAARKAPTQAPPPDSPFIKGLQALFSAPATATQAGKKPATTHTTPLRIDTENFAARTFTLPVAPGDYSGLGAGKGLVLWFGQTGGEGGPRRLHIFDMKSKKDTVLDEIVGGYTLSANGEQIIVQVGNDYAVSTLEKLRQAKKTGDKLKLDGMVYRIDTIREWTQIFNDTWRWYREYYYDAGMHGQDWKAIGAHYRAMIGRLTSRARLNWMMSEMVGELSTSHAYISGGDMNDLKPADPPVSVGRLGADLAWDEKAGCYKFTRIFGPTDFNLDVKAPLVRPDIKLKEGDWLLAIDNRPLRARADYNRLLQVTRGQKVNITVNDKPTMTGARVYRIEPLASDKDLRYYRWVADNISKVDKASNGRLGYMHFRDMSVNTIAEFDKFWRAFHDKEGIIIDVRGNSGGFSEYFLIDKLERPRVSFQVRRDAEPMHYPDQAGLRNYVALTNQDNGSCGELFLDHFRAQKLGTIIGTRSWGGLVGIYSALSTVDGGLVNQPNVAFYGQAGKWWVEDHGIDPDITLDNDPASVMAGKDVQLDKAIEVMLAEIEKEKKEKKDEFPPVPAYPHK